MSDNIKLSSARGVVSFDYNGRSLFVDADVETVSNALAKHRNAPNHKTNIVGQEIELSKQCFFVFRFTGHRWTQIIGRDSYTDSSNPFLADSYDPEKLKAQLALHLGKDDAQAISEHLETKVLLYSISDTAGAIEYRLYDKGEQVEYFEEGEKYDEEGDCEDFFEFHSERGEIGPKDSGQSYEWINQLFRNLECYEPGIAFTHFVGYVSHNAGDKVTIKDQKEDFERIDFVAL